MTYDAITAQTGLRRTGVFFIRRRHADGGAKALRYAVRGRKVGEGHQRKRRGHHLANSSVSNLDRIDVYCRLCGNRQE